MTEISSVAQAQKRNNLLDFDHHKLRSWRRYALPGTRLLRGYSPFPMSVTMHITLTCNLRCEMCCQQQDDLLQTNYANQMSFENFKAIIANIVRSFPVRPRLHITGGEPSIHRHFLPAVQHATERGFVCTVTSNGAQVEPVAEDLVATGLHSITLSLDGVEEVHNRIRGRADSYARVVASARAIHAARDRAGTKQPMITLNTAITRHNYHRLVDVVGLAVDLGADYLTLQQLIFIEGTRFAEHEIENVELLIEQMEAAYRLGQEAGLCVQMYPYVPNESLKHYYHESVTDDPLKCVEPWLIASVMPNGDVQFCFSPVAGNALETPFDEIWRGPVLREHRRKVAQAVRQRNGLPSDLCQRCCYRLYD